MIPYQALILDADNTLFDFDRAEKAALRRALAVNGYRSFSEATFFRYHRINEELWKLFEQGLITQVQLRVERFRRLVASLPPPRRTGLWADPAKIGQHYIQALSEKGYLLAHARPVLRSLAAKVPLLLLSNGIAEVQRRRIIRSRIGKFFRAILISGEVGLAKPDPAIFELAVEMLECAKEHVLCVGDSPSSDIRGGRAAGLATCWYAPPGLEYPAEEPSPLYTIHDLRQLLNFVPKRSVSGIAPLSPPDP
jgi:YjjG family noncanonical pyrimidine nucleotidase